MKIRFRNIMILLVLFVGEVLVTAFWTCNLKEKYWKAIY